MFSQASVNLFTGRGRISLVPCPISPNHKSWRYVSYWNAFLLWLFIIVAFQCRYVSIIIYIIIRSMTSGGSRISPRRGRQLPKVLLFYIFFAKNCMKMKESGPPGGVPCAPLRSANDDCSLNWNKVSNNYETTLSNNNNNQNDMRCSTCAKCCC